MAHHVDLETIENYVRNKCYPAEISGKKGDKANFRRACRKFSVINGQFIYKGKRAVITSRERQHLIIHDVHVGLGDDPNAKAMASHRDHKIAERFYWHNIISDISEYIKKCDQCQKHIMAKCRK